MPLDLTDEERAAVLDFLQATPQEVDDLIEAVRVAAERHRADDEARRAERAKRGLAVRAAHHNHVSWRALSARTGVPMRTLALWAQAGGRA